MDPKIYLSLLSVSDVWVSGRRLLRDRQLTTLDEQLIVAKARKWGDALKAFKEATAAQ